MRQPLRCLLTALLLLPGLAFAQDVWRGAALADLLDELNRQGLDIIYSSDLVGDAQLILVEPDMADPVQGLRSVLRPLQLQLIAGPAETWLVVQGESHTLPPEVASPPVSVEPPLEEIVVTSSLHSIERLRPDTHTFLDRERANRTPGAAEEVLRLTARLPGTASGGISVRDHVRGGEENEVLFLLDGLRLYEPFHLKNFQSVATIVNSNAVDGFDFYSGAFPARYGDRMSGVIDMHIREPEKSIETELALSFFNTSLVSMGRFGKNEQGDWMIAARRGNLDLIVDVVDPDVGNPDYQDYILHAGWEFGPRAVLSANALVANDKLFLADVNRGEQATANYRNRVLWLKWIADWSDRFHSETILSLSDIDDSRVGSVLLPGVIDAQLDEVRRFRSLGLKQDWTFTPSDRWMLMFGFDAKRLEASYRFDSRMTIDAPFDRILDNTALVVRSADLAPEGSQFGIHAELRWKLSQRLTLDAGYRRDHQNYRAANKDAQSSPRVSLLYRLNKATELRLGWGQYSQAQEINELQVADGINDFFPAQRVEHRVANLSHTFTGGVSVDVSLYEKSFRVLRPRFENAFNTLTLLPEIQFDRVLVDASSAVARGVELQITQGKRQGSLFWWLGYAWSQARDQLQEGKTPRSWDQLHTLKAGLSWRWGRWDFSAAGEAHTGWPRTRLFGETVIGPGGTPELSLRTTPRNSERRSVYHTMDIRISRDFAVRRGDLTAFLEVTNLFDRANPCCTEYALDESGALPVLSQRTGNWLPLVPSLGVVWRF